MINKDLEEALGDYEVEVLNQVRDQIMAGEGTVSVTVTELPGGWREIQIGDFTSRVKILGQR